MLTQGKSLGVSPIKCEAKEGTDKLKDLHYRINDLLYRNCGRYLFKPQAEELFQNLCALGKELSALEVPDRARPKKDELLSKLRIICNSLATYRHQEQTSEDIPLMQKTVNWWLHQYIAAKASMDTNKALELLAESKTLHDCVFKWEESLKLANLVKANHELAAFITNQYQI